MSRSIFITLALTCCSIGAHAEPTDSTKVPKASYRLTKVPSFVVYAELGGPAQKYLSLHAELPLLRFRHSFLNTGLSNSIRVSAGVTVLPNDRVYVPLMLKYLMYETASHVEIGAGVSILAAEVQEYYGKASNFPASPVLAAFSLGYRYEPTDGWIVVRLAYTPIFEFTTQEYRHGVGFSAGVSF